MRKESSLTQLTRRRQPDNHAICLTLESKATEERAFNFIIRTHDCLYTLLLTVLQYVLEFDWYRLVKTLINDLLFDF